MRREIASPPVALVIQELIRVSLRDLKDRDSVDSRRLKKWTDEMGARSIQQRPDTMAAGPPHSLDFPRRETLVAFLRTDPRKRVRISTLAKLLGAPAAQVRQVLRNEGLPLSFDSVEWGEAAAYVFDAWPRAQIIDVVGPAVARTIPAGFHPAPVQWRIPRFILRAMEYQAALMRDDDPRVNATAADGHFISPAVEDYVADLLFSQIQPSTVTDLGTDLEFLDAYHYPPLY